VKTDEHQTSKTDLLKNGDTPGRMKNPLDFFYSLAYFKKDTSFNPVR